MTAGTSTTRPRARHAERGSLWTGLVVVLAVIAAIVVILALVAGSKGQTAQRGWRQSLGTPEQLFAKFPAREPNSTALALERLADEIGLDVVPRHAEARRRVPARRRSHPPGRAGEMHRAVRNWADDVVGAVELEIVQPPPEVERYLDQRRGPLDAIQALLVDEELPCWTRSLESLHAAPIPNLLGLLELEAVLVADALLQADRGDEPRALERLQAAWRIVESLADQPEQVVNLVGVSMARRVAGALRFIETAPATWIERLESIDFRSAVLLSMQIESWMWTQIDVSEAGFDDGMLSRTLKIVAKPYMIASMADMSERLRRRIDRIIEADPHCDADLDALGIGFDLQMPVWSVARQYYGSGIFGGSVERVNRLELDLESTARLIELRAVRLTSGGLWPAKLPGATTSRACPGDHWTYGIDDAGTMRLGLDREPSWHELPHASRSDLPVRVVVR